MDMIFRILRISAMGMLVILMACTKDPSAVDYFNENYSGTYKCVSGMYAPDPDYLTDPIDFVGNGEKTKDILAGLKLSSEDLGNMNVSIFSKTSLSASEMGKLTFWVPLQNIEEYNQRDAGYPVKIILPNYVLCPIAFYYCIDTNGDMQLYNEGDLSGMMGFYHNYLDYFSNPQLLNCEKAQIVNFGNGEITLKISLCYVDFTDGKWITSHCFFKYTRI